MSTFDIRYIPQIKNPYYEKGGPGSGDEFIGGHDEFLESHPTKQLCLKHAKRISRLKRVNSEILHEIYVRIDDGDVAEHWYFKNGRQTFYDKFDV
jgi:hypothetical protein